MFLMPLNRLLARLVIFFRLVLIMSFLRKRYFNTLKHLLSLLKNVLLFFFANFLSHLLEAQRNFFLIRTLARERTAKLALFFMRFPFLFLFFLCSFSRLKFSLKKKFRIVGLLFRFIRWEFVHVVSLVPLFAFLIQLKTGLTSQSALLFCVYLLFRCFLKVALTDTGMYLFFQVKKNLLLVFSLSKIADVYIFNI